MQAFVAQEGFDPESAEWIEMVDKLQEDNQ